LSLVFLGSAVITIVATPWINNDALIIPKVILLFTLALYLLPTLYKNLKTLFQEVRLRILFFISITFILNMILTIVTSEAPWEQEFFGRTGRGLGFTTYFSLYIVTLYTALKIRKSDLSKLFLWLSISCLLSSVYSLLQYYGLDTFEWRTQTNGIIGTIGNPNFQSSFISIAFVPACVYLWGQKFKITKILSCASILLFTLYICESTQGYIALAAAITIFILIYQWYLKDKIYFTFTIILTGVLGTFAILGMLNRGPLRQYLYKVSVQSRGEMWDTGLSIIKDNPLFGIGLDSFGDYSLMYQSEKTSQGIAEYIDNVHNFFIQFAATGGISLAIIHIVLLIFTAHSFLTIQKNISRFDNMVTALFAAWISYQLQSIISPAAIPSLVWNYVISGAIIGMARFSSLEENPKPNFHKKSLKISKIPGDTNLLGILLSIFALLITLPLFHADKLARQANLKRDANLAVEAAKKYPESVVRYNLLGADLYNSGLYDLSLEIGRSAVKFNPNSYQTWILVLLNPKATTLERNIAKAELMKIDPYNSIIRNYKIE